MSVSKCLYLNIHSGAKLAFGCVYLRSQFVSKLVPTAHYFVAKK